MHICHFIILFEIRLNQPHPVTASVLYKLLSPYPYCLNRILLPYLNCINGILLSYVYIWYDWLIILSIIYLIMSLATNCSHHYKPFVFIISFNNILCCYHVFKIIPLSEIFLHSIFSDVPGEKRKCQCMNKKDCPDHMPVEEGDCLNLVECCPKKKKSEL